MNMPISPCPELNWTLLKIFIFHCLPFSLPSFLNDSAQNPFGRKVAYGEGDACEERNQVGHQPSKTGIDWLDMGAGEQM